MMTGLISIERINRDLVYLVVSTNSVPSRIRIVTGFVVCGISKFSSVLSPRQW